MATWLLLTADLKKLAIVLSNGIIATHYDVPFSHNTYVTEKRTDYRCVTGTILLTAKKQTSTFFFG